MQKKKKEEDEETVCHASQEKYNLFLIDLQKFEAVFFTFSLWGIVYRILR